MASLTEERCEAFSLRKSSSASGEKTIEYLIWLDYSQNFGRKSNICELLFASWLTCGMDCLLRALGQRPVILFQDSAIFLRNTFLIRQAHWVRLIALHPAA